MFPRTCVLYTYRKKSCYVPAHVYRIAVVVVSSVAYIKNDTVVVYAVVRARVFGL